MSQYGDGTAMAVFKNGALFNEEGSFKSDKGKLSERAVITDGDFYQKYSYVIKTSKSYSDYNDLVKTMVHPAGFKMFGQLVLSNPIAIQAGLGGVNLNLSNTRGSVVNYNLFDPNGGYTVGDIIYFYNNDTIHNDSFFSIIVDTVDPTGHILTYTVTNRGSGYLPGKFTGHGGTGSGSYIDDISISAQGNLYTSFTTFVEQSNYNSQKYISAPSVGSIGNLQNIETVVLSDTSFTGRSFQVLKINGNVNKDFSIGEIITETVSLATAEVIGYNNFEKILVVVPSKVKIPVGSVTITGSNGTIADTLVEDFYTYVPANTQSSFEQIATTMSGLTSFIKNETVQDWTFSTLININSYTKRTNYVVDSIVLLSLIHI